MEVKIDSLFDVSIHLNISLKSQKVDKGDGKRNKTPEQ